MRSEGEFDAGARLTLRLEPGDAAGLYEQGDRLGRGRHRKLLDGKLAAEGAADKSAIAGPEVVVVDRVRFGARRGPRLPRFAQQ